MIREYSMVMPEKVSEAFNGYKVCYDVRETSESELAELWASSGREGDMTSDFAHENRYGYYSVVVKMGQWRYDGVVNAIIRDKYRSDEMEAITNNMAAVNAVFMQTLVTDGIVEAIKYLKESADSDDTADFKAMQEWRELAKREAKMVFGL